MRSAGEMEKPVDIPVELSPAPTGLAADVAFAVGFGLFWALTRNVIGESLFASAPVDGPSAQTRYVAAMIAIPVLLAMAALLRSRLRALMDGAAFRRMLVGVAGAFALCGVLAVAACPSGAVGAALLALRDVLFVLSLTSLALAWGALTAARFSQRTVVLLCLAFVVNLAVGALQPLSGAESMALAGPVLPVLSSLCWLVCVPACHDDCCLALGELERPVASLARLPLGMVALLTVFLLVVTIARSVLLGNDLSQLFLGDFAWTAAIALVLCVVVVAVASQADLSERSIYVLWGVFSVLLMGSVLLMIGLQGVDSSLCNSLSLALCVNVYFLLYVMLVRGVGVDGASLAAVSVLFFAVKALSTALAYVIMPALASAVVLEPQARLLFSLGVVFMMVVCLFGYVLSQMPRQLRDRRAGDADTGGSVADEGAMGSDEGPAGSMAGERSHAEGQTTRRTNVGLGAAHGAAPLARTEAGMPSPQAMDACALLARDYGISERELDVLRLVPSGNTYRRIGELLYISQNTVLVHVKAIFKKTGTHSKQELIDLLATYR